MQPSISAPRIDATNNNQELAPTEPQDRKSYLAAFLLTAFLGLVGTNRLYTGHYLIGWLRCLLVVVSILAPALFLVSVSVGILATVVAVIAGTAAVLWWYVDLWLYYLNSVKDKETNSELIILGKKDKAYARSMMVSSHLLTIALPLVIGVGVAYAVSQIKTALPNGTSSQTQLPSVNSLDQLQQLGL